MPDFVAYTTKTKQLPEIRARVYIQDPIAFAGEHDGLAEVVLPGEAFLGAGPTTSRVEVIDYDETRDVLHKGVRPLARGGGFAIGRRKPRENFRHHQVNVWAIVTRTLNMLEEEAVLGRRIPWAFPGGRLTIRPHAGVDENAWYDRETGTLSFLYFEGEKGPVYTCLSHDIVTHELGHAVLDGLKPLYSEIDGPETAGFHEYFGDALAIASALTLIDVLKAVVRDRPTRLSARNLISDIALEFGSRGRGHIPLRSAANARKMSDLRRNFEEHDHSEVLTGVFYDILRNLYADEVARERDRRGTRKMDGQIAVHSLISAARRTNRMMLRAIDYLPPVGLRYVDYARAIIASDRVAYPIDDRGYRKIALSALRERGVLRRNTDAEPELRFQNDQFRDYDIDRIGATPTDAYVFLDANREVLQIPRSVNFEVHNLYRTRKVSAGGYFPPREVVIEFHWSEDIELPGPKSGVLEGHSFPLLCGGTLVFDSNGNVLHYVIKAATEERKRTLRAYLRWLEAEGLFEIVEGRIRARRVATMHHEQR